MSPTGPASKRCLRTCNSPPPSPATAVARRSWSPRSSPTRPSTSSASTTTGPPPTPSAQDEIVLTDGLAGDLGVEIGDTVTLLSPAGEQPLQVGGTSDEPIPARAYLSLDEAARIAGTPAPPVNGLYLRVDPDATAEVRTRLYDQTGAEAVKVRQEMRDDLASLLAVFNVIIAVMLTFALAMAFALVFNAMTVTVLEREREYATMRAIGARPRPRRPHPRHRSRPPLGPRPRARPPPRHLARRPAR